jgi:hypothetical protein
MMTTVPITLHLNAEAAKAYESIPAADRKKIEVLLGLRLEELLVPGKLTLREAMDQVGREATANGLTPEILESIRQDEYDLILRTADGREYVLAEVDDFDREVALVRQNQELMDFLDQRSRPSKTYTIEEARKILELD